MSRHQQAVRETTGEKAVLDSTRRKTRDPVPSDGHLRVTFYLDYGSTQQSFKSRIKRQMFVFNLDNVNYIKIKSIFNKTKTNLKKDLKGSERS